MENLSEDGLERCKEFGDWSTCSSEHWDEDHGDSSGFGDWTTFKEGLSEESDSVYLSSQEGQTSDHENKVIFYTSAIMRDMFDHEIEALWRSVIVLYRSPSS